MQKKSAPSAQTGGIFHLKENGTNVRTELSAGLTTFVTLAYIVALNPNILTNFADENYGGQPLWNAVFLSTCIASAIAMVCMAFLANKPFVLAPGMGLNSFFTVVASGIAATAGVTYLEGFRAGLAIIFVEGIMFIVLSLLNVRQKIVDAIPMGVRMGISPAIGLMLMELGFGSNAAVSGSDGRSFLVLRDFFSALSPRIAQTNMGDAYPEMVLTVVTIFVGLFTIVLLSRKGVKAAVLPGMLVSSVLWWAGEAIFLGRDPFASLASASFVPPFKDLAEVTLFKLDFATLFKAGAFTAFTLIVTFCMIDMFDTIGTFMGAASMAGMLDEKGNMPKMREALLSDAVGTSVGAVMGTSTVTTYVESSAGVQAGGRTGLTALAAGALFLSCIFIAPIARLIPASAASAALIYVGVLMLTNLKKLHFDDIFELLPVALMLISMPVCGSIGHAIGIGMIADTVLRLFSGRVKEISPLTWVICVLFLIKFFAVV